MVLRSGKDFEQGRITNGLFNFRTWGNLVSGGLLVRMMRLFLLTKTTDEQVQSVRSSKDVGMITLKIKRVKRVGGQAANPIQPSPDTFSGKRKADNLRVG